MSLQWYGGFAAAAQLSAGAYAITAASGTFVVTGNATSDLRVTVPADTTTFTLTGNATSGLQVAVPAATTTFTLTGNATSDLRVTIPADTTTFALTGNAANLSRQYTLVAASGTFTLTGNAATLTRSLVLVAASATFTLTGNATSDLQVAFPADTTTFTLTGNATSDLQVALPAAAATFVLTGNAAGLTHLTGGAELDAESGTFVMTGYAAGLFGLRYIEALAGTFTLSAPAVGLLKTGIADGDLLEALASLYSGVAFVPLPLGTAAPLRMRKNKTRSRAIPAAVEDPRSLQRTAEALREAVEVMQGQRAGLTGKNVSLDDLVSLGVLSPEKAREFSRE